jgi:hypothetical protein
MAPIESSITVPTSVDDIFAFLSKCESHLKFIPRMVELQQTSPGDFGQVGTTATGTLNYFGIRIPVEYEVIEHQPDQRLAMNGVMGPVRFRDGYILNAKGNGTEIIILARTAPHRLGESPFTLCRFDRQIPRLGDVEESEKGVEQHRGDCFPKVAMT